MVADAADIQNSTTVSFSLIRRELQTAFERVWDSFVGLPRGTVTEEFPPPSFICPWYGSTAIIGGTWTGSVSLLVEPQLALELTNRLISVPDPDEEQIDDALRELANMIAGNVKSALPGICGLATPGSFRIRSGTVIEEEFAPSISLYCQCGTGGLILTLSSLHPFDHDV